ncbi:hypothetical protein BGX26_012932 [Mortierella sp. AD094]|nr:hypothetical protein BGX26_012932 [Mortierella sp. AD094]
MAPSPVPVDLSRILKFASESQPGEEKESFLRLFSDFNYAQTNNSVSLPSHPGPTLSLYIVRQPIPARHRRGFVENKKWSGLEGNGNTNEVVVVAQKFNEGSGSLAPSSPVALFGVTPETDESDLDSNGDPAHEFFPNYLGIVSEDTEDQQNPLQSNDNAYESDDYEDDEAESDESNPRRSKKSRSESRYLPHSFRPKLEDGELQYEYWTVAFLKSDFNDASSIANEPAPSNPDVLVILPRLSLSSIWTERVSQLLETKVMRSFVLSEVSQGRIGIDYKRFLEAKRDNRKSTRRVIR